jgi:hypothetical protein
LNLSAVLDRKQSAHNGHAKAQNTRRPDAGTATTPEEMTMPWTAEPPLAHPRAFFAAATCDAPTPGSGSRVYAIGGYTSIPANTGPVATVEAYDTAQKTWSAAPPMPQALGMHAAASIPGTPGALHVLGGADSSGTQVTAHEVYDPGASAAHAWSSAHPMLTPRSGHAAVSAGGLIYAIGGFNSSNNVLANLEVYHPSADQWTTLSPLTTPRGYLAAVAGPDGNTIYAIGGTSQPLSPLNTVEVYDIAADSWKTITAPPLPVTTCGLAAAVGPNGVIYAIGGKNTSSLPSGSASPFTANVYSYDPTDGWRMQAPLAGARAYAAAATGPDGLVYAIGGLAYSPSSSGLAALSDVEAYAFDKCDYIEYEIGLVTTQLTEEEASLDGGDLTPQQRAAGEKALAPLRGKLLGLEQQLKLCRQ